jgi:hypothetical protein
MRLINPMESFFMRLELQYDELPGILKQWLPEQIDIGHFSSASDGLLSFEVKMSGTALAGFLKKKMLLLQRILKTIPVIQFKVELEILLTENSSLTVYLKELDLKKPGIPLSGKLLNASFFKKQLLRRIPQKDFLKVHIDENKVEIEPEFLNHLVQGKLHVNNLSLSDAIILDFSYNCS